MDPVINSVISAARCAEKASSQTVLIASSSAEGAAWANARDVVRSQRRLTGTLPSLH
jgi:hypothetical protein